MKKLHFWQRFAVVFGLAAVFGTVHTECSFGQGITTGGIAGAVIDSSGAAIAGATVTAANLDTNIKTVQHSRGDGTFTLLNLPVGNYSVTIEASGFQVLRLASVTVAVGQSDIGPQTLKVGAATDVVQVQANETPLLTTTQAQVTATIDSQQITNLPFGGGFDTAALLTPGVVITHDNSFSNNNGAYGGFSSQGERGRSNNFEIDGQSNNDNSVAGPQVFFSNPDAISSIEVITNNFSAQYGRNAGSVVNYLTRSGSNAFHATAFEWYEGNWGESFAQGQKSPYQGFCPPGVSATTGCVTPTLPRYVDNRFGGSFGGPLWKDHVFFFSSAYFDRYRNGGGTSINLSLTPTPSGLQQLEAAFPGAPGVASLANTGPYSVKAGNPQPVGTVYQIPVTIGSTTAPVDMAGISRSVPSLSNDEEVLGRIDWQASSRDHIFLRYFYQDDPYLNAGGSVTAGNWYNVPDTAHSVGADLEHTFSPNWVDQLRYSFQQTSLLFQSGAIGGCTAVNPNNCSANISLSGKVTDSDGGTHSLIGYGYATNIPQGRVVKVTQVQDNATWTTGRQTILFGGEYDYQNSPNPFLPDWEGAFVFSGATGATNPLMSNFLTGTGSLTLGNGPFTSKFTENDFALYFQDDWKLTPHFTANLGVRYEFFGQAVNLLHNETLKRETNSATAFWDQSLPLSVRTFPYTNPDYHNVQPRIGFAWNPALQSRLVVRGGFAINFDPAFYNIFLNSATAAPVVNLGTISGCGPSKQCLPSSGSLASQVRTQSLPYIPTGPGINPGFRNTTYNSPNFHNPYTESWLLGFEYGLGSHAALDVKYVGNHQVGNFQSTDGNPYLLPLQQSPFANYADVNLCSDPTQPGYGRPDCSHANVRTRTNGAFAEFNGLETRLSTKSFHGLTSELNWTYSRTIDNASEIFSTYSGGNSITFSADPLNPNQPERGVSGDSMTHDVSAGFTYRLPFFPTQQNLLGKIVGGWDLNGIYTFNTGQPGTPYQYGFFGDGPEYQSYTADVPFMNWQLSGYDVMRPVVSNPKAPLNTVGVYDPDGNVCGGAPGYYNWADCTPISASSVHWLRNTQSLVQQLGADSPYIGVGRNTVRANTWNNIDASLYKSFRVTERVTAQFQLIAYNAWNRQYLGTPDLGIDDVSNVPANNTFEDSRFAYGSNRNTQLGLKFIF